MRKHRLYGVVIAVLLGTGALTQRSTVHRALVIDAAGMRLTSAQISGVNHKRPAPRGRGDTQHTQYAVEQERKRRRCGRSVGIIGRVGPAEHGRRRCDPSVPIRSGATGDALPLHCGTRNGHGEGLSHLGGACRTCISRPWRSSVPR